MVRIPCENDTAGHLFQRRGAVKRVGDQIFFLGQNIFRSDEALEFEDGVLRKRHHDEHVSGDGGGQGKDEELFIRPSNLQATVVTVRQ